jgi:hypothetical protein
MESDSGTSRVFDISRVGFMPLNLKFNWSESTIDQRKMLFVACNKARKDTGLKWPEFFAAASVRFASDADYEQNFRKGKIHKQKAAQLYRWLCRAQPKLAVNLHAALSRPKPTRASEEQSYFDLLFRKRNYSSDGPVFADQEWPLDAEPKPKRSSRTKKRAKAPKTTRRRNA